VRQNADDLVNDLYVRLTEHPVRQGCNPESYAVKSYKNLMKDRARSCNRRRARDVEVMRGRAEASTIDPATRTIRQEQRQLLKVAIRRSNLRCDHRCALWAWMRDSLAAFAKRREIPLKTARVWAWRARQSLRPHLQQLQQELAIT